MVENSFFIKFDLFIAVIFSSFMLIYPLTFEKLKTKDKLLGSLFLPFLVLGMFSFVYSPNFPAYKILNYSFIIFYGLYLLKFKKKMTTEYYYLSTLTLFSVSTAIAIILDKYSFFLISSNYSSYEFYLLLILIVAVTSVSVYLNKQESTKLVTSSLLVISYFTVYNFFPRNQIEFVLSLLLLIYFFSWHKIHVSLIYLPLQDKLNSLEKEVDKRYYPTKENIKEQIIKMEKAKETLVTMSQIDKMTKVFNKTKIISLIDNLISDQRTQAFSVLMFDIDNFKKINDSLGHIVGDKSIISLASIAKNSMRTNDHIGRYGGDEFIILLPGLNALDGKIVAERFREKVQNQTHPKFTISIGVSSYPNDGKTASELIQIADNGLYLSKERGKNKVSHVDLY